MAGSYFNVNPGEYLMVTLGLTTQEHGVFLLLIIHQLTFGAAPEDPEQLKRITKCKDYEVIESVLNRLFGMTDDGWVSHWFEKSCRPDSKGAN